ncbi:MAG: AAA family ATPase [Bacteroidota bacterium]
MRISMCGSFSTGKTTLVRSLADALIHKYTKDVFIIEEVARKVIAEGFPLDRNANLEAYFHYIYYQLQAERLAGKHQYVVSDRSLLDSLAYIHVSRDPGMSTSFVNMLTEIVWKETTFFDLYCYVPVEFSPIDDGIRSIDHEYQHLVDKEMVKLLDYFGVRTLKVSGTVESRVKSLMDLILT